MIHERHEQSQTDHIAQNGETGGGARGGQRRAQILSDAAEFRLDQIAGGGGQPSGGGEEQNVSSMKDIDGGCGVEAC
ncbi:hypothetical protein D3C71_1662250 [compost metagenome]